MVIALLSACAQRTHRLSRQQMLLLLLLLLLLLNLRLKIAYQQSNFWITRTICCICV
jgi:hypothetical protein